MQSAEADLLTRAVAGDRPALEQLLHAHHRQLLAYVERHLPVDLARVVQGQDVLQETYFDAFRRIATFRTEGESSFYRWLVTIARYRLTDMIRRHRAAKRGSGKSVELSSDRGENHSLINMLQELAVYERTPSRSAAAHELCAAVQQAVDRLPPDWSQAIRLHYIQGMGVKEAAAKMQRSEGAFLMLCNRALKQLRTEMHSASLYF